MKKIEKVLKAFANRRRLEILQFIKEREKASVGEIAHKIGLSFKSTSKHLGVLFSADLIEREQVGLQIFYNIPSDRQRMVLLILNLL